MEWGRRQTGSHQKGGEEAVYPKMVWQLWPNRTLGKGVLSHGQIDTQEECGKAEQSRGRGPRCFNCHQLGHIAAKCPSSVAMFCRSIDRRKQPVGGGGRVYQSKCPGISRAGTVEGTAVSDIMLDTGATRTLVRRGLVPKEKIGGGEISICCAHGDIDSPLFPGGFTQVPFCPATPQLYQR